MPTAEERSKAEIELLEANVNYADPAKLAVRMQFWDLGMKNEPRCLGRKINPEDTTSCECMKAGANTAAVCTLKEGYKCFMNWPLNKLWTPAAKSEKKLDGCAPTFPSRTAIPAAPVGAALAGKNCLGLPLSCGHMAVLGGIALLLLVVFGNKKFPFFK